MISISIRFDFDSELETLREKTDGGWMFRARVARIGAQRIEGIEETNDDGGVIADRGRDRVGILFFARSGAIDSIRFDSKKPARRGVLARWRDRTSRHLEIVTYAYVVNERAMTSRPVESSRVGVASGRVVAPHTSGPGRCFPCSRIARASPAAPNPTRRRRRTRR